MKTKIFYSVIILIFAFAACDKQNINNKQEDKDALENFLTLNQKYQKLKNQTKDFRSTRVFKKIKKSKSFKGDGVDSTGIWGDWETCATVTETKNDDGSFTLVIDYGEDGCEEFGTLIKGKITMIWKIDGNKCYFEEIYENYYMYEVTINGKTTFEDTWDGNYEDSNNYSFSWSGEEDMKFTFDDGEVVEMKGKFKEKGDANSYTVLEGVYSYSSSLGYSFSYEVTKPLVYDYTCQTAYIPVEGTEKVNYVEDGESEEFVMDYGDGTCDNKYTITINGVTKEYDYDDEDWWGDDDDWNDSDSTNVSG